MRSQAGSHSPGPHVRPNLQDAFITAQKKDIDWESHADGVHGLAGHDPKTLPGPQAISPEQATPPRTTGFRHLRPFGNDHRSIQIFDADRFQGKYWVACEMLCGSSSLIY
jgi:hypothetical protein